MEFFKQFVSNTVAGSGNQSVAVFEDENAQHRCRIYYKAFCGGEYDYSFLFSNIIDSTFSDGSQSRCNLVVDSWNISSASVCVTDRCNPAEETAEFMPLLFGGAAQKDVSPGEFFCTDAVKLNVGADEYICLELSFSGGKLPNHNESIIPSFLYENGEWISSPKHPFASMVGIRRNVKKRIGFIGDSITQGIGTEDNSYDHWNAVFSRLAGTDYACWNLGLGFGRAYDASSDGAWLFKAKQNDLVYVCFGVNDIQRGRTAQQIKDDLKTIGDALTAAGVEVIFQTVPPFDYADDIVPLWQSVNDYIINELGRDYPVFDCTQCLSVSPAEPQAAKYGGHPNAQGCKVWGEALFEATKKYL